MPHMPDSATFSAPRRPVPSKEIGREILVLKNRAILRKRSRHPALSTKNTCSRSFNQGATASLPMPHMPDSAAFSASRRPVPSKEIGREILVLKIEQYFASAQDILLSALEILVHGALIRVPQRVCPCHTCRTPQHSLHLDVPCQAKRLDGRYWCSKSSNNYFASAQDILLSALEILVHGALIRVPQRVCPCHTCRTPQHSLHLDVPCQAKRLDGRYWCSKSSNNYFASAQDILLSALEILVHGALIRVPQRVCPCHTCRTPQHSLHLDVPCQAKRLDGRYWCSKSSNTSQALKTSCSQH